MNIENMLPMIYRWSLFPNRLIQQKEDRLVEKALLILGSRLREKEDVMFTSPDMIKRYLRLYLTEKEREVFLVLFLDTQYRVIEPSEVFCGSIAQCEIHPREVVKQALSLNAAAVVLAHNHPSGCVEPSQSDRDVTNRLIKALDLFDIVVLDHMIVGGNEITSMSERGLIL